MTNATLPLARRSPNNEPIDQSSPSSNNTAVINNDIANLDTEGINVVRLEQFESHRLFLRDCLEIKRIPNGLVVDLEPSIGNHDGSKILKNFP